MNHPRTLVVLGLALVVAARAGEGPKDEVRLRYDRLDLADGRRLENVVVRSYDPKSDKVLVIANGKALVIPLALVPAPINENLKRAPVSGETANTLPAKSPPVSPETQNPSPTPPRVKSAPSPATTQRRSAGKSAKLKEHQAAARLRAQRYFEYEILGVSDRERIDRIDLDVNLPVPVIGWAGRFRTEGKALVEYIDLRSLRSRRLTGTFEVTTEETPEEGIKVVDFTRKS